MDADIKQQYEDILRKEEEDRLAAEKAISEILVKGNYQYLISVNLMGAEIALGSFINPSLPLSIRLVPKLKEQEVTL